MSFTPTSVGARLLLPTLLLLVAPSSVFAQVTSTANGPSGSGYPALIDSGFELETPDCVHQGFGAHITQEYDAELDRNVFVFHSHIEEDNDRCLVFDRVRMEIKGSANTIPELRHSLGDTTYYRWKFRLDEDYQGASSFNHLFQNKAKGGDDTSFPILTITARADRVELLHNGGDTGQDLGRLAQADIDKFRGRWVEGYMRQVHAEDGELDVTIKDMGTGLTIMEYSGTGIDLWREGASLNRPKWGVYRRKNTGLVDETVRFANFCVSEESEDLCPGEAVLVPDTEAPTQVLGLAVTSTSFTSVGLEWEAAEDEFGVTGYQVYSGDDLLTTVATTEVLLENLESGNTYNFSVVATDAAGNLSERSAIVTVVTDDANALPGAPALPSPADGARQVSLTTALSWTAGSNNETFDVYFGTTEDPPFVGRQNSTAYQAELAPNTTYFWRVEAVNRNGSTSSPIWTFTTGADNPDAPWFTYRGNDRPEREVGFFPLNTAPADPALDIIIADPDDASNSIFGYRSDTDNFKWRTALDELDSSVTIVTRVKGIDDDATGMMHLDVRAAGWRQKIRLNSSSIKLERSSPAVEVDLPFDWNEDFHVVRIVVTGPTTTVYLDENPEPFMTGQSSDSNSATYFEWGKSGGSDYGAFVDWMVVSTVPTTVPGAGPALPQDLVISRDATLTGISVNGSPIGNFAPDRFDYVVEVPDDIVPTITWETSSPLAMASSVGPTADSDTTVISVLAQDGLTSREYRVVIEQSVATVDPDLQAALQVFPNPVSKVLNVQLAGLPGRYHYRLFAADGRAVTGPVLLAGSAQIDVSELPAGLYVLAVIADSGRLSRTNVVIR